MARQRPTRPAVDSPQAEDAREFRAAVRDVKPLPQSPSPAGIARPARRPRPRSPVPAREPLEESMPLIAPPEGAASGADVLSFHRPQIRPQVMRRLRRGLIPIDDELDLHGLSQAAAREQLAGFLAVSRDAGMRCVRIIHGKGYRSGARGPILKIAVDTWLRRHLDVMAFTSARGIDGGTGAVYVLLRS
jgi:DNA-nicking Smr family endonuclease